MSSCFDDLVGKIYRHFKGDLYEIIAVAKDSSDNAYKGKLVVYKALYEDCQVYVQPLKRFFSDIPKGKDNPTGQQTRFEEYRPSRISEYEMGD